MQGNMNNTAFGQAFLKKVAVQEGELPENFFVYEAGWIEAGPSEFWNTMKVKGCQFRAAKTGPNKGEFCIPVKGTEYMLCVTKEEMRQAEIDMAMNEVDEDFSDEQMEEMRKLEEEHRINEIKRKVTTADKIYICIDGVFKHYSIGACLNDTFNVWTTNEGSSRHLTLKYSDVPASAKFFELVEMK